MSLPNSNEKTRLFYISVFIRFFCDSNFCTTSVTAPDISNTEPRQTSSQVCSLTLEKALLDDTLPPLPSSVLDVIAFPDSFDELFACDACESWNKLRLHCCDKRIKSTCFPAGWEVPRSIMIQCPVSSSLPLYNAFQWPRTCTSYLCLSIVTMWHNWKLKILL